MKQMRMVVVDDEPDMAQLICDISIQAGLSAYQYTHAEQFINEYSPDADIIALDLMMPGIDGIELIRFLAEKKSTAQLLLISGIDSGVLHSAQKLAMEKGLNIIGSLSKPFRIDELSRLLSQIVLKPSVIQPKVNLLTMELDELREACHNREFIVYYQPQINLSTGKVISTEALVRWNHPQYGLILPGQFIGMIEQHNMIDRLTWCVLEQVMYQSSQWIKQDVDLRTSVNMSAKMLQDLDLPDKLADLVRSHGMDPDRIILEITETALMDEIGMSLDILTRLRLKNFHLSIDDFGTGYSSMVQLHRAPFSEIKIDQSFVFDMEKEKEALAIVETIIMLAHKLGMQAIAEGVETEKVMNMLQDAGCDLIQGYYIARPMPGDEFIDWLKKYSLSLIN